MKLFPGLCFNIDSLYIWAKRLLSPTSKQELRMKKINALDCLQTLNLKAELFFMFRDNA